MEFSVKQIISGSIGSTNICGGYHNAEYYVIYASLTKVVIALSKTAVVVQILEHDTNVSSLDWCLRNEMIVVGELQKITVYTPTSPTQHTWQKKFHVDCPFPISSVSVSPAGSYILAAGSGIKIWTIVSEQQHQPHSSSRSPLKSLEPPNLKPIEEYPVMEVPARVTNCSFSPDGAYFATISDNDPLLRIWYSYKQGSLHNTYLNHNCAVLSMSWRPKLADQCSQNSILTYSRDLQVRLWLESPANQRLQFSVVTVIQLNAGSVVDWLRPSYLQYQETCSHLHTQFPAYHALHVTAPNVARQSHVPLSKSPAATYWLVSMEPNGALTVWRVKGLQDGSPTTHSIWSKLTVDTSTTSGLGIGASSGSALNLFAGGSGPSLTNVLNNSSASVSSNAIAQMTTSSRILPLGNSFLYADERQYPINFTVYLLTSQGLLRCWNCAEQSETAAITGSTMNVPPPAASSSRVDSTLVGTSFGHSSDILKVNAHPFLPIVASTSENRTIYWKVSDMKLAEKDFLLNPLTVTDNIHHFGWTPIETVVIQWDANHGLCFSILSTTMKPVHAIATLPNTKGLGPYRFITVVEGSEGWLVLAVPMSGHLISMWLVANPRNQLHVRQVSTQLEPIGEFLGDVQCQQSPIIMARSHDYSLVYPFVLVTASADGHLAFWDVNQKRRQLTKVASFPVASAEGSGTNNTSPSISWLGSTANGVVGTKIGSKLDVWRVHKYSDKDISLHKESTIDLGDANASCEWLDTVDGSSVLAVSRAGKVELFMKNRKEGARSFEMEWKTVQSKIIGPNRIPDHASLTNSGYTPFPLAWLPNGTLIASSTNQLYVFSKWQLLSTGSLTPEMYLDAELAPTIFHKATNFYRALPYYHPKVLREFLNAGAFNKVEMILLEIKKFLEETDKHLELRGRPISYPVLNYDQIITDYAKELEQQDKEKQSQANQQQQQSGSSSPFPDSDQNNKSESEKQTTTPTTNEQPAQISVAPKSFMTGGGSFLSRRLAQKPAPVEDKYDFLSSSSTTNTSSDPYDFLNKRDEENAPPPGLSSTISDSSSSHLDSSQSKSIVATSFFANSGFTSHDAQTLTDLLSRFNLPHVSKTDQMLLLAVIETYTELKEKHRTVDDCGIRFLLSFKMFSFLRKSLGPNERPETLSSIDFAWGLHSDAQDYLLSSVMTPSDTTWSTVRSVGAAFWLKNPTTIRSLAEQMAKNAFASTRDPTNCALFYLALDKRAQLTTMCKAVSNNTLFDFLKNDFTTDKWKTAALKNAYVLLGKQRFELAAAFFLLGGQTKDCVSILIQKLEDFHLALFVSKLIENCEPGPMTQFVVKEHIFPHALENGDTVMLSLCHWILKDYSESVTALLPRNRVTSEEKQAELQQQQQHQNTSTNSLHPEQPTPSFAVGGRLNLFFNSRPSTPLNNSPPLSPEPERGLLHASSSSPPPSTTTPDNSQPIATSTVSDSASLSQRFDPSVLYFFNFLSSHMLLRTAPLPFDDLRIQFTKAAVYSYSYALYTVLALEQVQRLKQLIEEQRKKDAQKQQEQQQQAPAFSVAAALGRRGLLRLVPATTPAPESTNVVTSPNLTNSATTTQDHRAINQSMLFTMALQLLTQHVYDGSFDLSVFVPVVDLQTGVPSMPKLMLKQNLKFVCSILGLEQATLQTSLLKYCSTRHLLLAQYDLIAEKRALLTKMAGYVSKLSTNFVVCPNFPFSQLIEMKRVSHQLYLCCCAYYGRDISVPATKPTTMNESDLQDYYLSVLLGLMLYSWNQRKYSALFMIMALKPFNEIWKALHDPDADAADEIDSDSHSHSHSTHSHEHGSNNNAPATADEKIFLDRLLQLLVLYRFSLLLRRDTSHHSSATTSTQRASQQLFSSNSLNNSTSSLPTFASINARSLFGVATKILKGIANWIADLQVDVQQHIPASLLEKIKGADQLSVISLASHSLHSYQHIQSCHLLWDFIVDDVNVAQYLASLKFYHLVPLTQLASHYLSVSHTNIQRQIQHATMSLSIDIPDVNASLAVQLKAHGGGVGHSHSHGSDHSHSHGGKPHHLPSPQKPTVTVEASPSLRGSAIPNNSNNNGNNPQTQQQQQQNPPVTFEKSYTLYKDRDIVQSFCINTKNSSQFVLATTRGIMEITLDATKLSEMSQVIEDDAVDPNAPHSTPAPTVSVQRDKHELADLPAADPVQHHHPQLLQLNSSSSLVGNSQTNLQVNNSSSLKQSTGISASVVHSVSGGPNHNTSNQTSSDTSSNNSGSSSNYNNNQVVFNQSSSSSLMGEGSGGMKRSDSMVHMSPFHFLNARKKGQTVRLKDLVVNAVHPSPNGPICQWIEAHPIHPYYITGGIDGSIMLWQFNAMKEARLSVYRQSGNARVNRIHFNAQGTKFGACDMSGLLSLWRFDANESSLAPYLQLQCHTKRTLDFAYLNGGTFLATVGISNEKSNVCLWDTLLSGRSPVHTFYCHDNGASSVVYSPKNQLLITGGKKGDILVFDIRQRTLMETVKAHSMNVKSLALDPDEQFFVSGSNEGSVKIWSLPNVQQISSLEDAHTKQTFLSFKTSGVFTDPVSTFGVMEVMLSGKYLYTCGSDGRILRSEFSRQKASSAMDNDAEHDHDKHSDSDEDM